MSAPALIKQADAKRLLSALAAACEEGLSPRRVKLCPDGLELFFDDADAPTAPDPNPWDEDSDDGQTAPA